MRLAPRTILGQLIAGSVIVQMLVFGTFLAVSVRREFRETQRRDHVRLMNQAKTLANVLEESLVTGNRDMMDHIVQAIRVSTTIKGARITDTQGNTLRISSTKIPPTLSPAERTLLPELLSEPRYYTLSTDGVEEGIQPVMVDGAVRGIVWVTPDPDVTRRYPASALQNVLSYGSFALVGNLLLVWALSATISRPLRQLRRATMQVQNAPDDLSAFPLPVAGVNEAGALTSSFNAMVNEIERQRRGTQETLNLLDSMLTSSPFSFAFYDRDFRYVRMNDNMATLHGVDIPSTIGKRYRDLLPPGASTVLADNIEALLRRVFESGEPVTDQEISGPTRGESDLRTFRVSYFPVRVREGEVRWVGVIATEITERKKAEEAMRRSERLAAAGRLAASIAHEINNPLESVTNLLYLLQHHTELQPEAQQYAALAQQELGRVSQITQQTLRFYRQSTRPTDVSLPEVLGSVLLLNQARFISPSIEVTQQLSDDAILFGYAGELRQLFANLIGNAIDAMPRGGRLVVRARKARSRGKRGFRVTIADTGVGMSVAVRRRIFEPFFTTKEVTGTGLGLWVSDEILAKHRAVMQIRSRLAGFPGAPSGTVFSMFFPLDGVPRGPVMVVSSAQVLADHVM